MFCWRQLSNTITLDNSRYLKHTIVTLIVWLCSVWLTFPLEAFFWRHWLWNLAFNECTTESKKYIRSKPKLNNHLKNIKIYPENNSNRREFDQISLCLKDDYFISYLFVEILCWKFLFYSIWWKSLENDQFILNLQAAMLNLS